MAHFYKYDLTGEILSTGMCPDSMVDLQAHDGLFVAVGNAELGKQYVDNGILVDMPTRPSGIHKFNYSTKQWELDADALEAAILGQRQQLLQGSDWTQLPDVPLATKEAWAIYRQALRDITDQPGYPLEVVWPTPPA